MTAGYESAIAAHAIKPIFRPNGSAPADYGPGDIYNFLASGEETNNSFFQCEAIVPMGGGPPSHIHSREDETFQVLEGKYQFTVDAKSFVAEKCTTIFAPRGIPHTYHYLGQASGRLMCIIYTGRVRGIL